MNFSIPVLICDSNEDFRLLLKEMLTKHGYFYVLEATNESEIKDFLSKKEDKFVFIESRMITNEINSLLNSHKKFIVLSQKDEKDIVAKSVTLGVEHFLNYPIHSQKLIAKMESLS